jgi:hypothetical protein
LDLDQSKLMIFHKLIYLFMKDFLSNKQNEELCKLFLRTKFDNIWGATYTHHNKFTLEANEWDGKSFLNNVKQNTEYGEYRNYFYYEC